MEFCGVVMDVQNDQLRFVALVFELCKTSLKNHIFKNEENKPWMTESAATITCQWGVEILDALEFIHGKKIVHRDLKLENILVSHFSYYTLQISPSNHSNRGRKGFRRNPPGKFVNFIFSGQKHQTFLHFPRAKDVICNL